jgi:hypothetical protein
MDGLLGDLLAIAATVMAIGVLGIAAIWVLMAMQ